MFVASCTTLPNRVNNANFQESVLDLCNNSRVHLVYIHYPQRALRLEQDYPPIPEWMKCHPKLKVNPCIDFGPLTKVAPLLDIYSVQDSLRECIGVLLLDDDNKYTQAWWDELMDRFLYYKGQATVGREASLHCFKPFQWDKFNMGTVDEPYMVIKTACGVIYPRHALPENSQSAFSFTQKYEKYGSLRNDDMMLGAWCYKSHIPLYAIPTTPEQLVEFKQGEGIREMDALSRAPQHVKTQVRLATAMVTGGDLAPPWPDVVFGITVIVVILVFILVMCLLLF
jgi:hypothetical protein